MKIWFSPMFVAASRSITIRRNRSYSIFYDSHTRQCSLRSLHRDTTARSICTTDTFHKLSSMTFTLPSSPEIMYSIAGMSKGKYSTSAERSSCADSLAARKGAGMIHPNMATLLCVLCTDAPIAPSSLEQLLNHANSLSFNSISVDGSTSTNDTLAILANGAAGGQEINEGGSEDFKAMQDILTQITQKLSQLVVRDGEGATKFVRVRVVNSPSFHDTKLIASSIARDPLVKTALYGKDANWGRILCAIGNTPITDARTVIPGKTSVSFVPTDGSEILKLVVNGEPENIDEARAAEILAEEDLEILVDLGGGKDGDGKEEANYWFCDFSHEYGMQTPIVSEHVD